MGAVASGSLEGGVSCCHSDRDDLDLANDPSAPLRASASDDVVRPEAEQPPAVKVLSRSPTAPLATLRGRSGSGLDMDRLTKINGMRPSVISEEPSEATLMQEGDHREAEGPLDGAGGQGGHAGDVTGIPEHEGTDSQELGGADSTWKKPKEAARAAMRYLGFFGSGNAPPADLSTSEDFAVELLELALAVCTASAGDVWALAHAATRDDRRALRRLSEFVRRQGLMKNSSVLFSGSLTLKELARAFLGRDGPKDAVRKVRSGEVAPVTLSDLAARNGGELLQRGASNLSSMSHGPSMRRDLSSSSLHYHRTMSDLSCTSFNDFGHRRSNKRVAVQEDEAAPSLMEYLSVMAKADGRGAGMFPPTQRPQDHAAKRNLQLPASITARAGSSSMIFQSEGAMSYHSLADAMVGEGEEKETVHATVIGPAGGTEDPERARVAFRSRCLRTHNEWQRHLLAQQRGLLQIARQRREEAEQQLRQDEQIQEEQKALLRGFRKIIRRELGPSEAHQRISIFVVEGREELRAEMEGLCGILKYPCQGFRHFSSAKAAVLAAAAAPRISVRKSVGSEAPPTDNRPTEPQAPVRVVLLGMSWLDRELPEEWQKAGEPITVLTSEAEEFEEVGRKLLASGEAEIRERLREKGISDYLLHPLSLESLQGVVAQAIRSRCGDEYLLVGAIGRGQSGIVHQAKRLRDGTSFALKEISTGRLSHSARRDVEQETRLLQELDWPTVVFVLDTWENKAAHLCFLLMPLMGGGSVSQCTEAARKDGEALSRELVSAWYAQTLHGLTYLHWRGILHRDIKPGNLLLADDREALKIGDLGSAALIPDPEPHPRKRSVVRGSVTTPAYSGPEVWSSQTYMAPSDIWSVGVTFYEVMTLQTLFAGDSSAEMSALVVAFDIQDPNGGKDAGNVAGKALAALRDSRMGAPAAELPELLRREPLQRPSAAALANRPGTANRLRTTLAKTAAFEGRDEQQAHFAHFEKVVSESEAAADLSPQVLPEEPESVQAKRARRRQERSHSAKA